MFTSPLANHHFDFNTQYIQLPMIHPMTATTTPQQDITMTEHAPDDHRTKAPIHFMEMDQEVKAAQTLLEIHHAGIYQNNSDCSSDSQATTTSTSSSSCSSSPMATDSQEDPDDISESESSGSQQPPPPPLPQQRRRPTTTTTTTTTTLRTNMSGTIAKPRWSDEERNKLLMAVVEEKGLDQLTSFDWQRVARSVSNQTSATCHDRWRDHLLPVIYQLYQTTPLSDNEPMDSSSSTTSTSLSS